MKLKIYILLLIFHEIKQLLTLWATKISLQMKKYIKPYTFAV